MTALVDAERLLWLESNPYRDDEMFCMLKRIVCELHTHGITGQIKSDLERRIGQLTSDLRRTEVERDEARRRIVALEKELASDRLIRRVNELEIELKKARARTRLVEHTAVQLEEELKKRR